MTRLVLIILWRVYCTRVGLRPCVQSTKRILDSVFLSLSSGTVLFSLFNLFSLFGFFSLFNQPFQSFLFFQSFQSFLSFRIASDRVVAKLPAFLTALIVPSCPGGAALFNPPSVKARVIQRVLLDSSFARGTQGAKSGDLGAQSEAVMRRRLTWPGRISPEFLRLPTDGT